MHNNNQEVTTGLKFLTYHNRIALIHGVLKGLGIPRSRDDYQDLVQEGCLVFADVYAKYPKPITDERQLMRFAYQKIRWRLLDYLRHQQRAISIAECSLDDEVLNNTALETLLVDESTITPFIQLEYRNFFSDLVRWCSPTARQYLLATLALQLTTLTEIANYYGVSRQAVSQWKKRFLQEARDYLDHCADMVQ